MMFEFPGLSKRCELLTGELPAVVGYHLIWTSISGEVVLEFQDDGARLTDR